MARPNASRAKVLDAAARLAAEHGVSTTTVDEIASLAGVAKGSVYYNFASKEAIFETLIDDVVSEAVARVRRAREAASAAHVEAVTRAFLQGVAERPYRAKVVFAELLRTDRPWHEDLARHRTAMLEEIRLAHAADGGAATMLRAAGIFGAIIMVAFERTAFEPDAALEECVAAAIG